MKHLLLRSIPTALLIGFVTQSALHAAELAPAVEQVGEDIRYLASDELEGRGPDTPGLQKAADYIRARFEQLGLKGGNDGSFYRNFEMNIDADVKKEATKLVLTGPEGQKLELKLGDDFQPMLSGGPGSVSGEVVFAGYGISAPDYAYDDYMHQDIEGKIVVVIRREPQQGKEDSAFDGKETTEHSYIRTKLRAAKKAKAAAVLMVNDPFSVNKEKEKKDELNTPGGFGTGNMKMPFAQIKLDIANQLLAKSPLQVGEGDSAAELKTIDEAEKYIDDEFANITQPLKGWKAEIAFDFETVKADVTNVIGVLEGEGPHADETIVVGAHYDHLGYGPFGSRKPGERAIHNGADDNATGTAAVLELARRFATREKKPSRRMVFIAFTGEERGLIGSNYYLENPLFPLEKTVAMINFDMIGNMEKDGLLVGGAESAKEFAGILEKVSSESKLDIKPSNAIGGSDHAGFYRKGVPVLFFFTGMTKLYHTPEDDFETINVPGAVKAIDFSEQMLLGVLALDKAPEYVKTGRTSSPGGGSMAYLGVVPDYGAGDGNGLRITDVQDDSPASKGGLKGGDIITKIGDIDVPDIQGLADGLRKYKPDQEIEIVVRRDEKTETLKVKLGKPKAAG